MNTHLTTRRIAAAAIGLALVSAQAQAIVIFDNFGPGSSFNGGDGALVIDNGGNSIREIGASFITPATSYPLKLDSIDLALSRASASIGPGMTMGVDVHSNTFSGVQLNDVPSGVPIPSGIGSVSPVVPTPSIFTSNYSGAILQPSTKYWVVVTGNLNQGVWHYNPLGQIGQAENLSTFGWGYGEGPMDETPVFRIHATLMPPECYLTNPGFETSEFTAGGPPTAINDWAGDASNIVGPALGITPHAGQRMLQFDGTAPGGGSPTSVGSEVWQLLDMTHLAADIAAGKVFADFEYYANRVADDPMGGAVDTEFAARIQANSGSPAAFPANVNNFLALSTSQLISDNDPNSWEQLSASVQVPIGTTFLAVRLSANENIFNDATNEFAGHFADSACVNIRIVPEPSAALLLTLATGGLGLIRRPLR